MTLAAAALLLALPGPVAAPAPLASGVALQKVVDKVDRPVAMAFAPGDPARRLFVVEKTGKIRVIKGGRLLDAPYFDMTSRVSRGSEQGLLGIAFHPTFMRSGRLFVNYTDREGDTRVLELTVPEPAADASGTVRERELLRVEQPYSNHNGGHLLIERDGVLLIGLGDGGSGGDPQGHGQNPRSLLGKMLRLDTDAPAERARPEIVARGLRNPWRYALDRTAGDLFIADVGQHEWEEVHALPLSELHGANFGWNLMEGAHCYRTPRCETAGLALPVVEFDHDTGCSITGGVVYRGTALKGIAGHYFYSDYCTAILRSFRYDRRTRAAVDHWDWKKAVDPNGRLAQVASFGEDEAGEIYILSLAGTIWKLVPAGPKATGR